MRVSVALAYYNGGEYICEQINSILPQLASEDELIISVDRASDGSVRILESYRDADPRVILKKGPGKGVVRNFASAIAACKGDIIFLSDQDDIWMPDKVEKVKKIFEERETVMCVLHNASCVDEKGEPSGDPDMFSMRNSATGTVKNFIKNSYMGCCMAFRSEMKALILPIPRQMYMHDYWIGMAAEKMGEVRLLEDALLSYRRHGGNVTELHHGGIWFMIRKRINMLRCLELLNRRYKRKIIG